MGVLVASRPSATPLPQSLRHTPITRNLEERRLLNDHLIKEEYMPVTCFSMAIVEQVIGFFRNAPKQGLRQLVRCFGCTIFTAALCFLYPHDSNEAHADQRVSRTLRSNQSFSIYSYRCALSVASQSTSRIRVKCSRLIKNRFTTRPRGQAYLVPQQVAQVTAQTCSLKIQRKAAGEIRIRCAPPATPTPTPTPIIPRQVGGTVSGLIGTVELQNNGANNLSISSNGNFIFATTATGGDPYNVTVVTQPTNQTCTVTNGSGTVGNANVSNISVVCATNTTTLTRSVSTLALSVTGLTEYGVSGTPSSGLDRLITVTNTGSYPALNLHITSPSFPGGTTYFTTCGPTLIAGSSCTITISPGSIATSDGVNPCTTGTAPVPGTLAISADNAPTISTDVVVLGYACIYQGGYVFSFDDTTPNTASVGGKVLSTIDQAPAWPNGINWASNGGSGTSVANASLDTIPGIADNSTSSSQSPTYSDFSTEFSSTYTNVNPFSASSFASCNGATDGACNTANITTFYSQFVTNNTSNNGGTPPFTASAGPTNVTDYAAGLCLQTIASYSDWYLPAVCELGYDILACQPSSPNYSQNVQSNLVELNSLNLLTSDYWSSTEYRLVPRSGVQVSSYASAGASEQFSDSKGTRNGVRCARKLTS